MDFSKILLITDADGTMYTDDKSILDRDKAAISEFIQKGGLFTVATGRGLSLSRTVAGDLGHELINAPMVIFNGAAVYDVHADEVLWKCCLNESAMQYIAELMKAFPQIGVEVLIDGRTYVVNSNEFEEEHLRLGVKNFIRCSLDEVPKKDWIKILLSDSPAAIEAAMEYILANPCTNTEGVRSAPVFYEILPQGVNKGTGLERLLDIKQYEDLYIVAAGDYLNDIDLMRRADLSVAVANAHESVKKSADLVVCDNNSGAIGEILEILKKRRVLK